LPELVYDEATRKLRQIHKDREWFNDNYAQLKDKYNEEYIAVKNEDVIDSDKNLVNLLKRITQKYEKNHRSVIIECMSDHKNMYVF
jgi:hypothetical protein